MLELDRLRVCFGGLAALEGVTLTVHEGEVLGLIGPNGAGKTTLFNAISGLVRATDGKVRLHGQDITRMPMHRRARIGIGRTFQAPQPLHGLSVRENLVVAQRYGAGEPDAARLDAILRMTGLADKADADAASSLALAELKALEVAKALATHPRLLLLDEVLAGLETAGRLRFITMLQGLHQHFRVAIIVIEHDIAAIRTLCPRIAVLDSGRLIAQGPPDLVLREPAVIACYTGTAENGSAAHG
ncbi:ATP-binding cassette domain-containing protein [Duganella sp. FT92W]|uniref:ATP-binding cassette domain-containing protein n=1 Tax=Pseudoduganella rivuli TaxID=2666085 RepID=A0A7X2LUD8_9BURK|nr:ATP-binding cassette domain-containing protein [Pseudoduganella rivuli]MRV74296.1 ATP-binding cassette domain-containing protein [Pseudoduganella rivuli]